MVLPAITAAGSAPVCRLGNLPMASQGNQDRLRISRWSRIFFALLLSLHVGLGVAEEPIFLPDVPPPNTDSVEARIESLTNTQRELREQLNQVLKENESLSERLNGLQSSAPAKESADDAQSPSDIGDDAPSDMSQKALYDTLSYDDNFGIKSLFDSFHVSRSGKKSKPWYERMTIRGYSQLRFGRAVGVSPDGAPPSLFSDRSITDKTGTFSVRRARLILSEDVSDHLFFYFQTDFANNPADGPNTLFGQVRDLYADIYLDVTKIHRFRVGQSKIPWGFEEMQSSGNRIPLDRSDAIDTGDTPNQRDLGVFYYWTPEDKQKLLRDLVDGGLKGSGNYGIFGMGVYNGQGGSQVDLNRSLHGVARFTWPFQLASGQVVEMSVQGYRGRIVVPGSPISPQGQGATVVPAGVGYSGLIEQRLAGTFVWYPQPFGFQTEWNVGRAPGLNDAQTALEDRPLAGGYLMGMYKIDTPKYGILFPFARYQHYRGSYPSLPNAPFGNHDQYSTGVEWQIRKELEIVFEYDYVNGMNLNAINQAGSISYRNFVGQVLRCQMQINY